MPAVVTVALLLLPLAYLVVRASDYGDAADRCSRAGTLELVSTPAAHGGVVAAAIAIGVPLAWLVTRTDLPGRRLWAVAAGAAARASRATSPRCAARRLRAAGLLQHLLGVERLPEIHGYWGALALR